MTKLKDEDFEIVRGSGNVFKDAGFPNPEVNQAKALLAAEIIGSLRVQKLSTVQAAKKTGFDRGDFSRIKEPDLKRFTIDKLMKILNKLDPELEMTMNFKGGSKRPGTQEELSF